MSRRSPAFLYILLLLWAGISMAYYVAGTAALSEHWFHGERHGTFPFDLRQEGTLYALKGEAKAAGLREGDWLETLDGQPFTGDYQATTYQAHALPGEAAEIGIRTPQGQIKTVTLRLVALQGPRFSVGGYIAYLTPVLGVTLLSLLVGYWVAAARPRDPNAWLVLLLLTFPEASFGDISAASWGGALYVIFAIWGALIELTAIPALLWFGLYFPERSRLDVRFPWVKWLLYGILAVGSGRCFGLSTSLASMSSGLPNTAGCEREAGIFSAGPSSPAFFFF